MEPSFGRVIIKPINNDKENKTESGIIVNQEPKAQVPMGEIYKINNKCQHDIKEGDVVYYDQEGGMKIDVDSVDMLILPESNILVIKK